MLTLSPSVYLGTLETEIFWCLLVSSPSPGEDELDVSGVHDEGGEQQQPGEAVGGAGGHAGAVALGAGAGTRAGQRQHTLVALPAPPHRAGRHRLALQPANTAVCQLELQTKVSGDFTITISWLKESTGAFTFKTLC